jgi:hypothetical protein
VFATTFSTLDPSDASLGFYVQPEPTYELELQMVQTNHKLEPYELPDS